MAFKKYSIILVLILGLAGIFSCADVSLSGSNSGFTLNVTNSTGGPLQSLVVGDTQFTDVPAGETRNIVFNARPLTVDLSYTTTEVNGFGESLSKPVTLTTTESDGDSLTYELQLDSDYTAVWVETICETTGRNIDLVGIGTSTADDETIIDKDSVAFLNIDGWATYSNYRSVEDEEIPFSSLSGITGTIANENAAYMTITAAVSGETLTENVTGDDVVDGIDNCSGKTGAKVLRKSVVLMGNDGGTDVEVAADDGEGNLVSDLGYLDTTEGVVNSIDYEAGTVTYTLADTAPELGTITATYRYIDAYKYVPKSFSEAGVGVWQGSIVLKVGDTILAAEVYDEDTGSYYIDGDLLRSNSSFYDYTNNELTLSFFDTVSADTIPDDQDLELVYNYRIVRDADGDGFLNDNSIGSTTGSVDYLTCEILDLTVGNEAYFTDTLGHTITGFFSRYHIPYAKAFTEDIVADPVTISTFNSELEVNVYENLDFDGTTGVVDAYMGQKLIQESSVLLSVTFYDASGIEGEAIELVDDGNGDVLIDGTTDDIGDIDYTSGKIRLETPQATVDAGYVMASARALQYDYRAVTDSTKVFAGFFEKSDLSDRSFYVLNMNLPPGMVGPGDDEYLGFWEFYNFELLYYSNSAGSAVLNLVCGDDNFQ